MHFVVVVLSPYFPFAFRRQGLDAAADVWLVDHAWTTTASDAAAQVPDATAACMRRA